MSSRAQILADISMISANYGNVAQAETIHRDWFRFMGGQPGEVVFVENGSPLDGQATLFEGVKQGWITKLLSVRPGALDIGKHQAYVAEISALAMATRRLALLYHLDVLVAQRGHDDWLLEATEQLRDPNVFAVGGSFNAPSKAAELSRDFYLSKKLSGNFALLPRARYQEAWLRIAGDFLRSGYRDAHPLPGPERRFLMEVGLEKLLASRDWHTVVRRESSDWAVFHTNLNGGELEAARERFLRGEDVAPCLNAGDEVLGPDNRFKHKYFGQPDISLSRQLRVAFGATLLGRASRRLRGRRWDAAGAEGDAPNVGELAGDSTTLLDRLALVVWVDTPSSLASGLDAFYATLGARPRQVVALASAQDPAVDLAWRAHADGATDKLLVSRSLPAGAGPSFATLADHGVFAHAHSPIYALCRASALPALASSLLRALKEGSMTSSLALPEGAPLGRAQGFVRRRRDLLAELEARTQSVPVLGVGVPGEYVETRAGEREQNQNMDARGSAREHNAGVRTLPRRGAA